MRRIAKTLNGGRILKLPPATKDTLKGGHRTIATLFGVHPLGCCGSSKLWWRCRGHVAGTTPMRRSATGPEWRLNKGMVR